MKMVSYIQEDNIEMHDEAEKKIAHVNLAVVIKENETEWQNARKWWRSIKHGFFKLRMTTRKKI